MKNKSAGFFEKDSTKSVISSLIAILIGLLVGLVIILIANPADALEGFLIMLTGGFQEGMLSLGDVLAYSVPVMMTGLSIAFAYKTGEFNIGVPGQYYVGAFVALLIGVKATFLPDAYSMRAYLQESVTMLCLPLHFSLKFVDPAPLSLGIAFNVSHALNKLIVFVLLCLQALYVVFDFFDR